MPIATLSASEAIHSMKSNLNSRWPKRGDVNRLSPMARPAFDAGFTLPAGGKIFTIGSCFARNVENALQERGFNLPALDVLNQDDEFNAVGPAVMNNYGTPSIYNELKWAFEDETDEDACFFEMSNGWVDLHLKNSMRPADLDVVRTRRRAIRAAYRSIVECDAVIITLGLSEVWFDTQTGYYLNLAPRRSMLRDQPERFELHVLTFAETMAYLQDAMELIKRHGRSGIQVIVTVSPVPLFSTYRDADVMVANTYSKSVLRTAAEEITHTNDFVHYFPSYESITLSDRAVAYQDDEVHVTKEIVDFNIGRMVQAYTGDEAMACIDEVRSQLETYRSRPRIGFEALTKNTDYCADPQIAAVLTECSVAVGRLDVADLAVKLAQDPFGLLKAAIAMAKDAPAAALAAMTGDPEKPRDRARAFSLRIRANLAVDNYDAAAAATKAWASEIPNSTTPLRLIAQTLSDKDDPRAEDWFAQAVKVSDGAPGQVIEMAEFLVRQGKTQAARERLEQITEANVQENRRVTRLLEAI